MWVIVAKKGLDKYRDDIISEILGVEKNHEPELFLKKNSYGSYSVVGQLHDALTYKQQSSCRRLINRFESTKNSTHVNRWDKFYHLKEYHLSYRKVHKDEWVKMCDYEINKLTISYNHHKDMLEKKKKIVA